MDRVAKDREMKETKKEERKQKQGIDLFIEKMISLSQTNPCKHAITKAISEMIATDKQLFQIVEDVG